MTTRTFSFAICLALARVAPTPEPFTVIVLPAGIRDSMSAVWADNNRHWDELSDVNTLTQLIGGQPTQREYLGCLTGEVARETLWIRHLAPARNLKQLQFAAAGDCDHVSGLVGTWHTHPYRATASGRPEKERTLSALDLETFRSAKDVVAIVVWDVDSLDVAAKAVDGTVRHPAVIVVR